MVKEFAMEEETPQNDENKNTEPSPPQHVTESGEILPENEGVPEDDSAEPDDAEVDHTASEDEVNEDQENA